LGRGIGLYSDEEVGIIRAEETATIAEKNKIETRIFAWALGLGYGYGEE
jgi:hypothetical protein